MRSKAYFCSTENIWLHVFVPDRRFAEHSGEHYSTSVQGYTCPAYELIGTTAPPTLFLCSSYILYVSCGCEFNRTWYAIARRNKVGQLH